MTKEFYLHHPFPYFPILPLFFAFFLLFHLSTDSSMAAQQADATTSFPPLTLQLKWRHSFQFAGFYAADIKGFYREAGLKVTLKQRLKKIPPIDILLGGETDYVLANGSALLTSHLQGKPVRALAVIFQHSPNILLSRKDSGIRTPSNLIGRRIMLTKGLSIIEFKAMLIHEGVDPKSVEIIEPSWELTELINGQVAATNAYITSGPFFLRQQGVSPSFLQPVNYGVDFYGDTLGTTEEELAHNPNRAKAFIEASLKGWQYAFEHQDELIDYILTLPGTQKRKLSKESLRYEAQVMEQLIQPKFVELGHINPGRFKHMADTIVKLGLIEPGYALDNFIFDPNSIKPQRKWFLVLLGAGCGFILIGSMGWLINRQLARTVKEKTRKYKESEQRFHDLVTLLPEMVWETDLTGRLTYVNQAALKQFGQDYTALDQDLFCLDMLIPEDRERASENMKLICQGKETGLNEYTALSGKRTTFPVWIRSTLIEKDGSPVGMRGIMVDISERRKLEDQLNHAQKMEAIGTLAGGIAHDFNNILTAILGYTELAGLHLGDDKKVQKDLDHVHKGALRARDLVMQILAFSRKSEKLVTLVDPSLIVKEALKLLRSSVPTTIDIQHDLTSSSTIQIDPTQFHQIMMNICTNGIQAMEFTGGTLTVTLNEIHCNSTSPLPGTGLKTGSYICLKISDTGRGMDRTTREKIFEPYFTTKELGKGTGLGLAVVHGIVREYNGAVTVYSELDQGTTFRVYLPVVDGTVEHAQPLQKELQKNQFHGRGERIMLIDDEEELVIMLAELLVHSGYRVCTYLDSLQAWDHFTKDTQSYDLILTDMTMPGLTGLELSKRCLALCPELPVILMTGFSEQVNQEKVMATGIKGFIQKPPETQYLLKKIRTLLEHESCNTYTYKK